MLLLMLVQHTKTIFMGMASIQVGEKKGKAKKKSVYMEFSTHATYSTGCNISTKWFWDLELPIFNVTILVP